MSELWDAVIVGAGPAGCAAAYDLAAVGRRVLLLDRAEFPRPKACAGGLTMKAVRALRYPIDPIVRRWVSRIDLAPGHGQAVTVQRRKPVCAMTVREELDSFCLAQTRARSAVFRRVGALAAIEQETDRVVVRFTDGFVVQARLCVGADGVHSRVRALATDGSWFRAGFALEANVPYLPGEQRPLLFDFAPVRRGYGWLFPRDNHMNVGLYTERSDEKLDRAALETYIAALCGAGREHSRPVGQFLGLGAARYQPGAESRVLLAGDAAGFVDPLTGEGIYGAIRSGQAAAAAIRETLDGRQSLAQAFASATVQLRSDLQVAEHAARRFYPEPNRGFALLRLPLLPRAVLRAYADGLPLDRVLRAVRFARRFTLRTA